MNIDKINIYLAVAILIVVLFLVYKKISGGEYYANDETCESLTGQYCQMMKDDKVNNLLQPAQGILSKLKKSCGDKAYLNIQNCVPSWTEIRGGNHDANLYPMLAATQVTL
jgi:hypothetical protein